MSPGQRERSLKFGLNTTKTFSLRGRKELKKRIYQSTDVLTVNNAAFQKVSSWGRKEVMAWFDSHKASADVKFFAEMAGVVDGHH